MNFFACWHRPGRLIKSGVFRDGVLVQGEVWACRHCGVPVEECPCVEYRISKLGSNCVKCEGSGWVAIVRSKRETIRQTLDLAAL